MSDTPRTDAHNWHDGDYDDPLHAFADFAKQLERELNQAKLENKPLANPHLLAEYWQANGFGFIARESLVKLAQQAQSHDPLH